MRVAITGAGVVTPIGIGLDSFGDALRKGVQRLSEFSGVPTPRGKAAVALIHDPAFDAPDRAFLMARTATEEALARAALSAQEVSGAALILSTLVADSRAVEDLREEYFRDGDFGPSLRQALPLFSTGTLVNALARRFGFSGSRFVISNACASGNIALGLALDLVRLGRCRTAVIAGVELVTLGVHWGAERSGFIGRALRPFHRLRDGSILGEGAGALVLQHPDDAPPERILGWVEGFGIGVDPGAAPITLLEDGSGLRRAMTFALHDAGRRPGEIEYVNAHAPGTPLIDRVECHAIANVFGGRAAAPAVNSTKSLTGHLSAASSIVEVIAVLLQMRDGFLHGHAQLDDPDPNLSVEVLGQAAVLRRVTRALSNACGGGGLNTSVVVAAPSVPAVSPTAHTTMEAIVITGIGTVSAAGANAAVFPTSGPDAPLGPANLDWFDIERWYPPDGNYGFLNRSARLGAAAGAIAIADARLAGYAADRVAVLNGTLFGGNTEALAVINAALRQNPDAIRPSTALDHGMHLSTSIVRRQFGYHGFTATLTGSVVAGLMAVVLARDLLAARRADAAVLLGHDALDEPLKRAALQLKDCLPVRRLGEGAGAVVLETAGTARRRSAPRRTLLRAAGMISDSRLEPPSLECMAHKLADEAGRAPWHVTYLAGTGYLKLRRLALRVADLTGSPSSIQFLRRRTNHCMAADPLIALAAAVAREENALVLAGEQEGAVAWVWVTPESAEGN
jgi:3-oxoacyl-[acyl-carrier-protein] synthase II